MGICPGLYLVNTAGSLCTLGGNRIATEVVIVPPCFPRTGWRCQMVPNTSSMDNFGASLNAPNHYGISGINSDPSCFS
jgi:hypothetical protein